MLVQVGDEYPVRYRSVDDDRELVAATLSLSITDPSGNVTAGSLSNPSTGIYEAVIEVDEAGLWQYTWTVTSPYDDVDKGQFTAATFAPPDYVSLALFKSNVKVTAVGHEELMALAIATASRQVEKFCRRRFYADPTTTVRTYRMQGRTFDVPDVGQKVLVDDIASAAGLTVEVGRASSWTEIAATGYDTDPENALADYEPITGLIRLNAVWSSTPTTLIRVTAKHGWPAIPQLVQHATLIQATRLYLRKDSPEGVMGTAEWGLIRMSKVDPDVQELLKDFVKYGAGSTG